MAGAKYTSKREFMHDFVTVGGAGSIPVKNWTQTAVNADKRETQRAFDFADHINKGLDGVRTINQRNNAAVDAIFHKITDRVQKEHPGMSRVKATLYARHKDPVGRKYNRLVNAGYGAKDISKALFGSGRHGTSRSGRGGG